MVDIAGKPTAAAKRAKAIAMARAYFLSRRARNAVLLRRRDTVGVASLDAVYPGSDRTPILAPETLETPEMANLRLHEDWLSVPRDQISTPAAWVASISGGIVDMPRNVVCSPDGKTIVAESVGYPNHHDASLWPPDAGTFDRPVHEVAGAVTTFRCFVHHRNHYHALIDGLPRLFGLITDPAFAGKPIQVLVDEKVGRAEQWFIDTMLPPNITALAVPGDSLVRADELLFPSYLTNANVGHLPQAYLDWFLPNLKPARPSARSQRVYISRRDVGVRKVVNETELIAALASRGFVECDLGSASLPEQAELFHDAEMVVSAHGAGLTNLLFGDNTGVVELFNSPFVRPHYYYLSKTMGHRWRYTLADGLGKNDDFVADIDAVLAQVDELERSTG